MPKRGVNVNDCEIARAYKVTSSCVEPISFVVPRRVSCESFLKKNCESMLIYFILFIFFSPMHSKLIYSLQH